jgi:hypothetical protein
MNGEAKHLLLVADISDALREVTCAVANEPLRKSLSLMDAHKISYLPLIQSKKGRQVKAVLQLSHLIPQILNGAICLDTPSIQYAVDVDPLILKTGEPLIPRVPDIQRKGYGLIRDMNGDPTGLAGIITKRSLCDFLYGHAECFVLLEQIERSLRFIMRAKGLEGEVAAELNKASFDEFTFHEMQNQVRSKKNWDRLGLGYDREVLGSKLEEANKVRNQVMHFKEQPGQSQVRALNQLNSLLNRVVKGL